LNLPAMVRAVGWAGVQRWIKLLDTLTRNHPPRPHLYLNILGVEPSFQGLLFWLGQAGVLVVVLIFGMVFATITEHPASPIVARIVACNEALEVLTPRSSTILDVAEDIESRGTFIDQFDCFLGQWYGGSVHTRGSE
jgi:hypothetical protein